MHYTAHGPHFPLHGHPVVILLLPTWHQSPAYPPFGVGWSIPLSSAGLCWPFACQRWIGWWVRVLVGQGEAVVHCVLFQVAGLGAETPSGPPFPLGFVGFVLQDIPDLYCCICDADKPTWLSCLVWSHSRISFHNCHDCGNFLSSSLTCAQFAQVLRHHKVTTTKLQLQTWLHYPKPLLECWNLECVCYFDFSLQKTYW